MHRWVLMGAVGALALVAAMVASAQEQPSKVPKRIDRETMLEGRSPLYLEMMNSLTAVNATAIKPKTVKVNCTKSQSITGALNDPANVTADALIIEISGVCKENVTINRDRVTLRGHDPAIDGIESRTEDPGGGLTPAVVVWRADDVVVENLTLRGGMSTNGTLTGFRQPVFVPFTTATNCVLEGSAVGASVQDGYLTLRDVTVRGSHLYGINAQRGWVECVRCHVEVSDLPGVDYGPVAVMVALFSRGDFTDSTIAASGAAGGLQIYSSSRGWVVGCTITAEQYALVAGIGALLDLDTTRFGGSLRVYQKAEIHLWGSTQTANPPGYMNKVSEDSILEASAGFFDGTSPSTLVGRLSMSRFGKAVLEGNTTVDGDVDCGMGGDAWAAGTVSITGSVYGCDHLPAQ